MAAKLGKGILQRLNEERWKYLFLIIKLARVRVGVWANLWVIINEYHS